MDALEEKVIRPCIPGRRPREKPVKYDQRKYKRRTRIEIIFGRLKEWRRIATRYDRCPTVFFSATCLAATVMFWLCVLNPGLQRNVIKKRYRLPHGFIDM